ncbi:hypothetical protein EON66_08275 [archaeon]|nr:MAG: hypothetical protein EON66_08275 [archaeon]
MGSAQATCPSVRLPSGHAPSPAAGKSSDVARRSAMPAASGEMPTTHSSAAPSAVRTSALPPSAACTPPVSHDLDRCAICLTDFQAGELVRPLPCCHFFHAACIDQWLAERAVCPLCKVDVLANVSGKMQPSPSA